MPSTPRPPTATPTSSSPMTCKAPSPGCAATPPRPPSKTASGCCGCSSRTSSSARRRSPSGTASPPAQAAPAPGSATPNPIRRVTIARVIYCVGGVVSPLLLNIALHGLEEAAGVRYQLTGRDAGTVKGGSPALTRYADDLVVCCHSRQQAEQVKARLAAWLAQRGLAFNEAKTRIAHLREGFDFLGFSLRRYSNGKLLIKPGATAIKRFRKRLAGELPALRGANAEAVLAKIVPITRGWCAYYKAVVSSRVFHGLDDYLWKLTYKWACWTHPNKPKRWTVNRYYR